MQTWQQAWTEALYGEGGFYRRPEGPAGHFTTSTHGAPGRLLAGALLRLVEREGLTRIVDLGCGRGELLTALAEIAPATVDLVGVDVVPRPAGLDPRIHWLTSPGGSALPDLHRPTSALVLAHEWLDVVPCQLARADADGRLKMLLVDSAGGEHLGGPLPPEDAAWAERWWPGPYAPDELVEIGLARDAAWTGLLEVVGSGVVVAVDYGHLREDRPVGGTFIGYAEGLTQPPAPDGSCDLTAHVAMDSLRADELRTQREVLRDLGVDGSRPPVESARADPVGYLAALERASRAGALTGPGPGDFLWAITRVG